MRIGLLTKEWPPENYGGAGVHVEYLTRELRKLIEVDVQCWGAPREDATAHQVPDTLADANACRDYATAARTKLDARLDEERAKMAP